MRKKNIANLITLIIIIFSIFGCSPKSENKIVLRFSGPGFPLYDKIRTEQGALFEKTTPNVKVIFQPVPSGEFFGKMLTQIAGGTAPDVFFITPEYLSQFIQKGALIPLDSFIRDDGNLSTDDFYSQVIDEYTYDSRLYGLSDSMTPLVLYYNKSLFHKAEIEYPNENWTWQDFLEAAKKLTVRDEHGKVKQFGSAIDFNEHIIGLFFKAYGGQFWDKGKIRCVVNSQENRDALQFLVDLSSKYYVSPKMADAQQEDAYRLFMGERAAMFIEGRWYTVTFRKKKDLNWDVAELPKGKLRATPLISHAWVISKQCKHPQVAYEFIKYICGEEGSKFILSTGDSVPPLRKLAESDYFLKDSQNPKEWNTPYIKSMNYAYPMGWMVHPKIPYAEMRQIIRNEWDELWLGQQDVETTLQKIQDKINDLIPKTRNN